MSDCATCDDCPMMASNDVLYEVHITVDNNSYFVETCGDLEMKPIIIGFENEVAEQVMATKIFRNMSYEEVVACAETLVTHLEVRKFPVKRIKIETTTNNPLCNDQKNVKYYEAHFVCEPFEGHELLIKWSCLHKSRNLLKKEDGRVQMMTFRLAPKHDRFLKENFLWDVEFIENRLKDAGIVVQKIIREACLLDTNIVLDYEWLNLQS